MFVIWLASEQATFFWTARLFRRSINFRLRRVTPDGELNSPAQNGYGKTENCGTLPIERLAFGIVNCTSLSYINIDSIA